MFIDFIAFLISKQSKARIQTYRKHTNMKSCLGNLILLVKKKKNQYVKDSSLIKFMFLYFCDDGNR